jgi:hypothetical protein
MLQEPSAEAEHALALALCAALKAKDCPNKIDKVVGPKVWIEYEGGWGILRLQPIDKDIQNGCFAGPNLSREKDESLASLTP